MANLTACGWPQGVYKKSAIYGEIAIAIVQLLSGKISYVTGETRNHPAAVLGKRGDKRCIGCSRLVVVRDTVTTFDVLRRYLPSERGDVPGGQPLIERHRQAARRFRSEQIESICMMDVRPLQSKVVEHRCKPWIDWSPDQIVRPVGLVTEPMISMARSEAG
jgi:hypothetical protein